MASQILHINDQIAISGWELVEQFIQSAGPGGQNVNKVATRVTLTHVPTGLSVSVQDSRSQAQNRQLARERLLELINEQEAKRRSEAKSQRELEKRRNRPRPRGVQQRILEGKKRRSEVKKSRGKVRFDD